MSPLHERRWALPITPFHIGIGMAAKGIAPSDFSLTVFSFVQVAIDSEVLIRMSIGIYPLHAQLHTYVGAAGIGLASVVLGRPICVRLKRWWNAHLDVKLRPHLTVSEPIPLRSAITGALIGTSSHVLIDSMMHPDIVPNWPWSRSNPMLNGLSVAQIHLVCVLLAVAGAVALAIRKHRSSPVIKDSP